MIGWIQFDLVGEFGIDELDFGVSAMEEIRHYYYYSYYYYYYYYSFPST